MVYKIKDLPNNCIGIYKINFPNGKVYIGQSNNIKRRMSEHNKISENRTLCDQAIKKYYGKVEEIEIIELFSVYDKELLNQQERYWIKYYNSTNPEKGYNLTEGGTWGYTNPETWVFSEKEILEIRKRRFYGQRKRDVYQDFSNRSWGTFEKIWLGTAHADIGQEFLIATNSKTRQEYSSLANSGENNNKAKLKKEDVIKIRERYDNGESVVSISKDYPFVRTVTVRRVCNRETWKNI